MVVFDSLPSPLVFGLSHTILATRHMDGLIGRYDSSLLGIRAQYHFGMVCCVRRADMSDVEGTSCLPSSSYLLRS